MPTWLMFLIAVLVILAILSLLGAGVNLNA